MVWLCRILLFLTAGFIAYQDLRTRLISLWLIALFFMLNVIQYLFLNTWYQLAENTLFCVLYILFSYLVLQLFYFVKTKKFQPLLDSKIGWGDVLLVLSIGVCIEVVNLIYFLTIAFTVSILVQLLFFRTSKSVPLAGLLAVCYIAYLLFSCLRLTD
jgi:hypothetical protein